MDFPASFGANGFVNDAQILPVDDSQESELV